MQLCIYLSDILFIHPHLNPYMVSPRSSMGCSPIRHVNGVYTFYVCLDLQTLSHGRLLSPCKLFTSRITRCTVFASSVCIMTIMTHASMGHCFRKLVWRRKEHCVIHGCCNVVSFSCTMRIDRQLPSNSASTVSSIPQQYPALQRYLGKGLAAFHHFRDNWCKSDWQLDRQLLSRKKADGSAN